MKIVELVDLNPVTTKQDYHSYQKSIDKKGYDLLGGGSFANVYKSKVGNKSYAVKLINGGRNQPKNDALIHFYKICSETNNPYFPKIYDIRTYKYFRSNKRRGNVGWNFMYIVHMERLNKFTQSQIDNYTLVGKQFTAMEKYFDEGNRQSLNSYFKRDANLKQAIAVLKSLESKYGENIDFHMGNMMLRGSDQLVFIDPFCN